MFESDKKSSLDRLRKGLYSRNTGENEAPRHDIHGERASVPESWDEPRNAAAGQNGDSGEEPLPELTPRHRYAYKVIFICSAIFLVIALAVAAYTFFGGGNYISVDNVDILIEGPATIAGGAPLSLNVSVVNKNQTPIQLVDLISEFPQGTKDAADPTKDLARSRISIGDIGTNSVVQQAVSSIMYGQEGDVKDIKFTAEYRTAGSNAIFFKEKVYHVTISSSPVIVTVDSPDKALSGTPFDMNVTIASNSATPVKDLLMTLDYPFGFSVVSSDPAASYGDNAWRVGDLAPGATRVIHIRATAVGQDTEQKTVHANVGIQDSNNNRLIATNIITQDKTITLEKPFLGLDLSLDGTHDDLAAQAGRIVHADIIWTNNSSSQITNTKIIAKLSGNALDQSSVTVSNGGFYDSSANTITWEAGRSTGLDSIAPGDNGRVSFTVTSLRPVPGQSIVNPEIQIAVSADGSRVDETGAPQSIDTAVDHSVKIVSDLELSARALYSQGPFSNSGSMPPSVDKTTTYTVVWTVTNTSNTVTGVKVSATLPQGVSWTGAVNPSDASISYDPTTGSVTWDAGDVASNADVGSGAKQVAFQVSLKPSANQAGTEPSLTSDARISGTDVFTGATITNDAPGLTTRITTDLLYKPGDETVQK